MPQRGAWLCCIITEQTDSYDCAVSYSALRNLRILVLGEMKVPWLQAKLTSIFMGNRGLAETEHPLDTVDNVSLTSKEYIQSPLGEKLVIIYFWIAKAEA